MFGNRIRLAGCLLILSHCTQAFVLLTANVEDIKRLARKFVSEPLAQQIADFITRASGGIQIPTNVSEENEENQNAGPADDESLPTIQRQGPSSKRYRTLTREQRERESFRQKAKQQERPIQSGQVDFRFLPSEKRVPQNPSKYSPKQERNPQYESRGPQNEGRSPQYDDGRNPQYEGKSPQNEGRNPQSENRGPQNDGRGPQNDGRIISDDHLARRPSPPRSKPKERQPQEYRPEPNQVDSTQGQFSLDQFQKHQKIQQRIQQIQEVTNRPNQVNNAASNTARDRPIRGKSRYSRPGRQKKKPIEQDDGEQRYELVDNGNNQHVKLADNPQNIGPQIVQGVAIQNPPASHKPQATVKNQETIKTQQQGPQNPQGAGLNEKVDEKLIQKLNDDIDNENQKYDPQLFQNAEPSRLPVKETPNQNSLSSEKRQPPMIMEADSVPTLSNNAIDIRTTKATIVRLDDDANFIPVKRYRQKVMQRERVQLMNNKGPDTVTGQSLVIEFSSRSTGHLEPKLTTEKEKNEFDQYDNPHYHVTDNIQAPNVNPWWERALEPKRSNSTSNK